MKVSIHLYGADLERSHKWQKTLTHEEECDSSLTSRASCAKDDWNKSTTHPTVPPCFSLLFIVPFSSMEQNFKNLHIQPDLGEGGINFHPEQQNLSSSRCALAAWFAGYHISVTVAERKVTPGEHFCFEEDDSVIHIAGCCSVSCLPFYCVHESSMQ